MNPLNYNRYTYVLNNPLKYTDPSGYVYRYSRIEENENYWAGYSWNQNISDLNSHMSSGGGGGYGSRISAMGRNNPAGWHYNSSTEEYWSGRTGERFDAGSPGAIDYMGFDSKTLDSKGEAYEHLGYTRTVLGSDKYGSQEVLYENNETGALKVRKEAFWQLTGNYFNMLYYYDGLVSFDSNAAFRFAQKYRNGGSPMKEGIAWSINAMFAFGAGWQVEVGRVKDNHGGKKWFINTGPTIGYDLSIGYQRKYIKGYSKFNVDMYQGHNTSIDAGLYFVDWTIIGGDNIESAYKSRFRQSFNEDGWGLSLGSPIGLSWQMGKTTLY